MKDPAQFNLFPPEEEVELTQLSDLELGQSTNTDAPTQLSGSNAKEKYAHLGTVGSGAMGEILLVRDQELRRKVAYKKVHAGMTHNRKVMDRFFTEAQITAQLDHPNIVPIYSLEVSSQGEIGYSMKLIQGKTLKELMIEARKQFDQTGKVDEDHSLLTLIEHFLKVCDAMHYSHIKGVIHRDLKPANIMVGRYNEVYVMDWGIAKVIAQPEKPVDDEVVQLIHSDADEPVMERTQLGQILGTPRYMSPQQAAGKNNELDARCDQFSLGLILFELMTLKPAFTAKTQIDLLKKVLKAELPPFVHYSAKVRIATELQAIVRKATALKTHMRYENVADLADDLRRFLRGEAVLAQPDNVLQKLVRLIGQHSQITLGVVLALFMLLSGSVIWSQYQQQQAMLRAQTHSNKMTSFLMAVAKRAQLIDGQFNGFEMMLERLSGVAVQLLEFGQPSSDPLFTHLDFYQVKSAPPDLSESKVYAAKISTDWANFKLSPGVSQTELEPLMRQISPLRHTFRYIALQSKNQASTKLKAESARSLILQQGVPMVWAFLGLKQGLLFNYPGNTGYNPQYDARKRPWYTLSLKQEGPNWKSPYIDASGNGWVLPCTLPLHDSKGQFLGVAGVEMTLEYIKHQFLEIKDMPGVTNSYILDEQGQVIASTQEKNEKFAQGTLIDTARELKPFPKTEVLKLLMQKNSGIFEEQTKEANRVYAFYPIHSLGWTYLVEAEPPKLRVGI